MKSRSLLHRRAVTICVCTNHPCTALFRHEAHAAVAASLIKKHPCHMAELSLLHANLSYCQKNRLAVLVSPPNEIITPLL